MDTVAHFTRLFAYDTWANQEVLAGLRAAPEIPARALGWIAHILGSERLWLERLEVKAQTPPVWPQFSVEECEEQAADMSRLWRNFSGSEQRGLVERIHPLSQQQGRRME